MRGTTTTLLSTLYSTHTRLNYVLILACERPQIPAFLGFAQLFSPRLGDVRHLPGASVLFR